MYIFSLSLLSGRQTFCHQISHHKSRSRPRRIHYSVLSSSEPLASFPAQQPTVHQLNSRAKVQRVIAVVVWRAFVMTCFCEMVSRLDQILRSLLMLVCRIRSGHHDNTTLYRVTPSHTHPQNVLFCSSIRRLLWQVTRQGRLISSA